MHQLKAVVGVRTLPELPTRVFPPQTSRCLLLRAAATAIGTRLALTRRPMASNSNVKDEAMKALESSLASTVELSKSLETKLSASESELADARAESAKLAREALELRAALAERDEQLAQLKAKAVESEAESEQSRRRLMALRQAGQEVVGKLGTAVLSAQEASAKPRPLEDILTPVATGAQPGVPETHARYRHLSGATLAPPTRCVGQARSGTWRSNCVPTSRRSSMRAPARLYGRSTWPAPFHMLPPGLLGWLRWPPRQPDDHPKAARL